jgi:hypothetical protein
VREELPHTKVNAFIPTNSSRQFHCVAAGDVELCYLMNCEVCLIKKRRRKDYPKRTKKKKKRRKKEMRTAAAAATKTTTPNHFLPLTGGAGSGTGVGTRRLFSCSVGVVSRGKREDMSKRGRVIREMHFGLKGKLRVRWYLVLYIL